MSDEQHQKEPPINPPGLVLSPPVPAPYGAKAPPAATEAQMRAYRNRSSGASWFDAPPEKVSLGRKGRRERGGGGSGGAFDVAGASYPMMMMTPTTMMMPPPPPQQQQLQQQQQRFSVPRQGTMPLSQIPIGTRCTGVIAALRESFGFISSSDFSDQIFFHVSEVLSDGDSSSEQQQQQQQQQQPKQSRKQQQPPPRDIASLISPGAEVEFLVGPISGRAGRQSALQVRALPPGSLCPFTVSEERHVGVVERELRGGGGGRGGGEGSSSSSGGNGYGGRVVFSPKARADRGTGGPPELLSFDADDLALAGVHDHALAAAKTGAVAFGPPPHDQGPRCGEAVEFSVATDKRTGERHATLVARRRERGVVAHVASRSGNAFAGNSGGGTYGFIRPLDRRSKQIFFHESQVVVAPAAAAAVAAAAAAASAGVAGHPDTASALSSPAAAAAAPSIKVGDEVTMGVAVLDAAPSSSGRLCALAVEVQPPGTFPEFVAVPGCERVEGRVVGGGVGPGRAGGGGASASASAAGSRGAPSISYVDEETGAEVRVPWKDAVGGGEEEKKKEKEKKKKKEKEKKEKKGDGDGDDEGSTSSSESDDEEEEETNDAADDDDDEASAAADAATASANASAAADASSSSPSSSANDEPGVDDDVVFTLARSTKTESALRAIDVELVRRGSSRRELGAIAALKGTYGLIRCCERPGTVLFRYEEFEPAAAAGGGGGGGGGENKEEDKQKEKDEAAAAAAAAAAASDSASAASASASLEKEKHEGKEDDGDDELDETKKPPSAAAARAALSKGDDVEFSIARDAKGRAVAVRVRRAAKGSAVFETLSEKVMQGWVVERLRHKGSSTISTGVVEFFGDVGGGGGGGGGGGDGEGKKEGEEKASSSSSSSSTAAAAAAAAASAAAAAAATSNLPPDAAATAAALAAATAAAIQTGPRSRLTFAAADLADPKINPRVGDAVVFRVATDPRVARAAARRAGASSPIAKVAGKRASRVAPIVLRGTVAMIAKGGAFGFISYDALSLKEAVAAGGGAAGAEAAEKMAWKKEGEESGGGGKKGKKKEEEEEEKEWKKDKAAEQEEKKATAEEEEEGEKKGEKKAKTEEEEEAEGEKKATEEAAEAATATATPAAAAAGAAAGEQKEEAAAGEQKEEAAAGEQKEEAAAAAADAAEKEKAEEKKEAEGASEGEKEKKKEKSGAADAAADTAADDADAASKPPPAAASAVHNTKLRVYFRVAEVEPVPVAAPPAPATVPKEGDEAASAAADAADANAATAPPPPPPAPPAPAPPATVVPVLRRGDLVEFTLAEKKQTRESVAHRVKKLGDARDFSSSSSSASASSTLASSSSSSRPRLFLAERNPAGPKFTSNAAAGVRGNLAVRLARCPPEGGARGFTPETSPGARAELVREYAKIKDGEVAARKAEANKLDPTAAEFVPPGLVVVGACSSGLKEEEVKKVEGGEEEKEKEKEKEETE